MSEFTLSKLEITGFRGITARCEIALGKPLTIIFGQNRNGKSSITNAVEWCLFGPEVAKISYGDIRERDGWEVQNLNGPTCHVQCEFLTPEGRILTVRRTYKTARTSDFSYEIEGGEKSTDEKKLHALLRISPNDFLSSVHLHPEIVRSLIVARPKERKEAIDRLLGLSELRDMVDAFVSQKPGDWIAALDQKLAVLDARLTTALSDKKRIIDDESMDLMSRGIEKTELTPEGAQRYAVKVLDDLRGFASQYRLTAPAVQPPADFAGIQQFRTQLPTSIQKLRNEHPALADQGKYLIRKSTLEGFRSSHANQIKNVESAKVALTSYPEKRSVEELGAEVSSVKQTLEGIKTDIGDVAKNARVLSEALTFFKDRVPDEQLACPVCGETTHSVDQWQAHIQQEIAARNLEPLAARKQELTEKISTLEQSIEAKKSLLKKATDETAKLIASVKTIEKALGRTISESDDPIAILTAEIDALATTLSSMQEQIAAINLSFSGFQDALLNLDRFQRVGKAQQEMAKIEAINENDTYKGLQALRSEADQYAEDAERLIEGLKNTVNKEAQQRLANVQDAISATFKRLTNRPDYPGLKVSLAPEGFVIELTSQSDTTRAVPILNHADINCAALSIFLALAASSQIAHRLGMIILDDPSQSLDIVCKKNLCSLLSDLCGSRQVILATADNELHKFADELPKNKVSYTVRDWTPKGGPLVEVEAAAEVYAV